jgi:hypothetical protein
MTGDVVTRALVHALHVWAWALCYGAISYTYFRLNQQMRGFVRSEQEYEASAAAAGKGLLWWTFGSIALAALTGAALAFWWPGGTQATRDVWWTLLGFKTAILVVLTAVPAYMGCVMWPRRAHAPRESWPSERRRFFWGAFFMGFLLLCELTAGAIAHVGIGHASH